MGGNAPSPHVSSDLPDSSSDAVVLATDGGRSGLGCQETKVISRSDFSEGEEYSIDNGEGGDVFGELFIETAHDESDDGLADQTDDHGVFGTEGVDDKGTDDRSRNVESAIWRNCKRLVWWVKVRREVGVYSLDDDTPSKDGRKRVISTGDVINDGRGVQTELRTEIGTLDKTGLRTGMGTYGVDNEVIQEPRGRDGKEPDPVPLNDQPVGDLGVPHGVALEPLRFLHPQPP